MISYGQIVQKMGKEGARQFIANNQHGERQCDYEKRHSKGRVKFKMCEHNIWIIENYEPKECQKCHKEPVKKSSEFKPHFNMGLGCYVESKHELKREAKRQGLIHIGSDKLR